jgi:hypothetical protein
MLLGIVLSLVFNVAFQAAGDFLVWVDVVMSLHRSVVPILLPSTNLYYYSNKPSEHHAMGPQVLRSKSISANFK